MNSPWALSLDTYFVFWPRADMRALNEDLIVK